MPDLAAAEAFYVDAFGLTPSRRFGEEGVELAGWPVKLYLLRKPEGAVGAGDERRRYARHWSPVHLDVVVDDLDAAEAAVLELGATKHEHQPGTTFRVFLDPAGHPVCLCLS